MSHTRILFSCDFHGSNRCLSKFLNAAKLNIYKAQVFMLSGDLTGKAIVPIVERPNGEFLVEFQGAVETVNNSERLKQLVKMIGDAGFYAYVTNPEEASLIGQDEKKRMDLFSKLMVQRVEEWMRLAEEKLAGKGVKCFVMPGNDDHDDIAPVIDSSSAVTNPEGKVVLIDEHHEMISSGYSSPTPWKTPREVPEEKLAEMIEAMTSKVQDMKSCIFNLHDPPYDSGLDTAPQLDEKIQMVSSGGQPVMVPVGSKAVRSSIEKYQPLLGLHGHIHESGGATMIGRTRCLNAGSEYQSGVLRGYIIDIEKEKVIHYLRIEG